MKYYRRLELLELIPKIDPPIVVKDLFTEAGIMSVRKATQPVQIESNAGDVSNDTTSATGATSTGDTTTTTSSTTSVQGAPATGGNESTTMGETPSNALGLHTSPLDGQSGINIPTGGENANMGQAEASNEESTPLFITEIPGMTDCDMRKVIIRSITPPLKDTYFELSTDPEGLDATKIIGAYKIPSTALDVTYTTDLAIPADTKVYLVTQEDITTNTTIQFEIDSDPSTKFDVHRWDMSAFTYVPDDVLNIMYNSLMEFTLWYEGHAREEGKDNGQQQAISINEPVPIETAVSIYDKYGIDAYRNPEGAEMLDNTIDDYAELFAKRFILTWQRYKKR